MPLRTSSDRRRDERRASRWLALAGLRWSDLNPFDRSDRPDEAFERTWRRVVRVRAGVVLALVAAWGVFLQARLVQLQVVRHEQYEKAAVSQQQDAIDLQPVRGSIVDRNGRLLAYSVDAERIGIHPRLVKDGKYTVAALCGALGDCTREERQALLKAVTNRRTFINVRRARSVLPEQVARVRALKLPGVVFEADSRRYYPGRDLAAHLLGFVNIDNVGSGGVEHAWDEAMRGAPGRVLFQVDAKGTRIDTLAQSDPVPGATVRLTLDLDWQYIVERELRSGVEASGAKAGTAIVMNPYTGEILAFANYPTFNPNEPWLASDNARRNRATQEVYEPGSTFKIITAAAALEEGVVSPTEVIQTAPGFITFSGRKPIRDTHNYGALSFEDVVVNSSNVGTIKVALRLGADRLARYVQRFGFGQKLAPGFSGASAGMWDPNVNDSGLASISMGYQVGVTPLQMVTAVSAIANGGQLMEPHILGAVVRNGQPQRVEPKVLRRVVQPSTAATLVGMLEGVVSRGTAKAGQVEGFVAAGKTGTAKKVMERGGYSSTDYNASFVGFVPSRQPEFTILVVIDTPTKGGYYGGTAAAPIFKRIAESLLLRQGVPPTVNPEPTVIVPAAPRPDLSVSRGASLLPASVTIDGPALMPDVRGLGAREALAVLHAAGLFVRISGNGVVQSQSPAPGAPIERGSASALELARARWVPEDTAP